MPHPTSDVLIIGAGLTGLTLAYRLRESGLSVRLLEGRDRIGGRILTLRDAGNAPREMGATWFGKKHTALVGLLAELGLDHFGQLLGERAIYEPISTSPPQLVRLPPNNEPSYRIGGGTSALIEALASRIDSDRIEFGQRVTAITRDEDGVTVATEAGHRYAARLVVSTLPPYLLYRTVTISPALPPALHAVLPQTHTWMGDSIKIALSYPTPFWRAAGTSGTIFSNVGPIPELYDHSDFADERYALVGFLNPTYFALAPAERRAMVLDQLRKYYGERADTYTAYAETVWRDEPLTFAPYTHHVLPHQHNGHPVFRELYLDGRLLIAGSETADLFPGYMDGAVRSAGWAAAEIAQSQYLQ
jgi:monoamine oxidase